MPRRKVYKNFKGMGPDFKKYIRIWLEAARLAVAEHAIDLYASLLQKTPVDTGNARGAWQILIDGDSPGPNPPPSNARFNQPMTAAERAYAEKKMKEFIARRGRSITFLNNSGYGKALEFGHSKQSPAGMVRRTLKQYENGSDQVVVYRGVTVIIRFRRS